MTFQPDCDALLAQIEALRPQVAHMVIVDNASTVDLPAWRREAVPQVDAVLRMERNLGIGGAQNRGIDWARAQGASHVLLMDQDSVPAADMVAFLPHCRTAPTQVLPIHLHADPRQPKAHSPFVWLDGLRFRRLPCTAGTVRMW
ncbi:MAG: glycosyltransferase [Burkholderiaceae bacterium]